MKIKVKKLGSKYITGAGMYDIVRRYSGDLRGIFLDAHKDLKPLSDLSLGEFFTFCKDIPYREDSRPTEIISRPLYILKYKDLGADCKKKAILMASFLNENYIPWRFLAVSKRSDRKVHHVLCQGKFYDTWVNLDCTYPDFQLFEDQEGITKREVL